MVSPTVYARRSLCYLISGMPQEALNDAMQAQVISPVWHTASYFQSVTLTGLGIENEAQAALKEGTTLDPNGMQLPSKNENIVQRQILADSVLPDDYPQDIDFKKNHLGYQ
ncbi:hypothetical protein AAZX31_03G009900 [Glycine max]